MGRIVAKRSVQPDWEWLGTEVKKVENITPLHRRRAAGLIGGKACLYKLNTTKGESSNGDGDVSKSFKDSGCGVKACKKRPRCYNHLGGMELVKPEAKESFVVHKLGHIPERRDGLSGLKNFGATCYANAFLQSWFHNIAFRNGVYQCLSQDLSLVFASLQYSEKKVVDPSGLIAALRLDKGNQQDAAEFSKLFMNLLKSEFGRQADPKVKTLLSDLFEGTAEWTTECNTCHYKSSTQNTFLELEITLDDGKTLNELIKSMLQPEALTGDNQYRCPQCRVLRDARRYFVPTKLPSILHFALNRFVYDPEMGDRKKLKANIAYPKEMKMAGQTYHLRSVITHQGSTAHHGHFVCEIYNESDDEWYLCNDEDVSKKNDRAKKKPKLDLGMTLEDSSRDAYMLVYKRAGGVTASKEPPTNIKDLVEAENIALLKEIDGYATKKVDAEKEFEDLKTIKMKVLEVLPGTDQILPRDELVRWINGDSIEELNKPFNFSSVTCEHGGVDPDKATEVKLVSQAAFEVLRLHTGTEPLDICATCIADQATRRLKATDRESQLDDFHDLNNGGEREWMISSEWLKAWKKGNLPINGDKMPDQGDYSLYCQHDLPWRDGIPITREALALLRSSVGEFRSFTENEPKCQECKLLLKDQETKEAEWKIQLKAHTPLKREFNPRYTAYGIDYYAIPKVIHDKFFGWWYDNGSPKPELKISLCEHGGIDFDPMMEFSKFVTAPGWKLFCDSFGPQVPIAIQYDSNPLPGKLTTVVSVSQRVCETCREKRLLDWEETTIQVRLIEEANSKDGTPAPNGNTATTSVTTYGSIRRSTRSKKSKALEFTVEKTTTIKDLKIMILTDQAISPISQQISYKGKILETDQTMQGIGFLDGDEVECLILEEKDSEMNGDGVIEGFGGTALVGDISCPDCTFLNGPGSSMCEVCQRPFGFG